MSTVYPQLKALQLYSIVYSVHTLLIVTSLVKGQALAHYAPANPLTIEKL